MTGRLPVQPFTRAHEAFRARAREFVRSELRPFADDWEDAGWFPNVELERAVRDARLGPIGGGTDEIMREILGRMLG